MEGRKTMVLMIGIQGSGKSEFCRKFLEKDFVRVNLDTLHTRNREKILIDECISSGRSFVVDNTNPTAADRMKYIILAEANNYHIVGYFMESRLRQCIERNNHREGKAKLPAKVIAATSNRLEIPKYTEGFDELYFVANDGTEMTISEWKE